MNNGPSSHCTKPDYHLFNVFFPFTFMTIKKYCKTILGHFYTVSAHYPTHEYVLTKQKSSNRLDVVLKTRPDICFSDIVSFQII